MVENALIREVSAAERLAYQRDGVVLLKQIYPKSWVEGLAALLIQLLAG
jgi:hypothetical protein